MIGRLLLRLAGAAATLLLVIGLCLALLRSVPGGPFDQERLAPPEIQAVLAARYRIDQPFWIQFGDYLRGLIRGELGPSFQQTDFTVNQLLAAAAPLSLQLGGLALLLALLLSITTASVAAAGRGPVARLLSVLATLLQATPKFVLAPLLLLWLALDWRWLPVSGYGTGASGLILPILALALPQWAWLHRICLAELDAVRAGAAWPAERSRGASAIQLWWQLAIPLLLPRLSRVLLPVAIALLTGSAVIEQVFAIPGMGRLLIQGALNRDYTVVMGVVCVTAALVLLLGLLSDQLARWLDPRLRLR